MSHPDLLRTLSDELTGQDMTFLGDIQYVYHCHHFNLFHDQTVEDALGESAAFDLRRRAAADAARPLLNEVVGRTGAATPAERLEAAKVLFAWMGHGRLEFQTNASGGRAHGEFLHYSFAWREKYGARIRRLTPIDAFAAGFVATATEVAFDLAPGTLLAEEGTCYVCREPACRFDVQAATNGETRSPASSVGRGVVEADLKPPLRGQQEETIESIARGLKDFVLGVEGDERGLVQGFGIYVTRHLASYYNATAFDAIHHVEEHQPSSTRVVEELFGESGHVCAFYTCGNILLSPEWEALVGPLRGEVEEIIAGCMAIVRALGFGHWTVEELMPGERLVMRCSSDYEAPFYLARYGVSQKPRCYLFANAARAFMQLAHQVDWPSRPQLDDALYQSLFETGRGENGGAESGGGWHMEQTACLTRGDEYGEVVVSRAS